MMCDEMQRRASPKPLLLFLLVARSLVVSDCQGPAMDKIGVNFVIPPGSTAKSLARKAAELGIPSIKIWDWNPWTIYQLRKYYTLHQRKLEIMVSIPQWIFVDGKGTPKWELIPDLLHTVRQNSDIVKGVFVYNEPCIKGLCQGTPGENYLQLLSNLSDELKDEGKMVTTPFASFGGILQMPPHQNQLRNPEFMLRVVKILAKTKAPAAVNLYPYLDWVGAPPGAVPLDFAEEKGGYTLFDYDLNNLRQALNSLGPDGWNTPVAIGETGWAHDFGPVDPSDYWRKRVKDISNFDNSNAFFTNVFRKMPFYLQKYKLYKIWIFELADEPTKPLFDKACEHGQDHEGWLKYKCGAYDGEKWFGISGLWTDSSLSPWNKGRSSNSTGAATMRKQEWETFHGEMARLKQSSKLGQGCTKDEKRSEEEQLEEDIRLVQEYTRQTGLQTGVTSLARKQHRRLRNDPIVCLDCLGSLVFDPSQQSCARTCDDCSNAIVWVRKEGVVKHPTWYANLSQTSSDRDFQMQIHAAQPHKCPRPCTAVVVDEKWQEDEGGPPARPPHVWLSLTLASGLFAAMAVAMGIHVWLRWKSFATHAHRSFIQQEMLLETDVSKE